MEVVRKMIAWATRSKVPKGLIKVEFADDKISRAVLTGDFSCVPRERTSRRPDPIPHLPEQTGGMKAGGR